MTTGGLIRTMPNPSPAPANRLRRRLLDAFLMLAAPAALFTALAPTSPVRVQVLAWTVFVLILIVSALMDRTRARKRVQKGHVLPSAAAAVLGPLEKPYPGAIFPSSLGPFNTQNGLDLNVAPESPLHDVAFANSSVFNHDDGPWCGPEATTRGLLPTPDLFESTDD
jgi:hypothetical protein